MSEPGRLQVSLLGGFEVWFRGEQLRGFESQKVRALFAYLLLHRGRALSRDRLAAVLWGEKDEESARRNLRQAVYNLKATLPDTEPARPHLLVDAQEIRFNVESDYWLDVEAFERATGLAENPGRGGGFRDLVKAAQLYRGDLLAGFLLRECPEFELWLVTEQERLREAALDTLRKLVGSYLARSEYRLGIQHARRLVAMDPLSEEAHRHLMRLYELAGRRGRALAHYTALCDLLRRELGVEPLAETRALHEAILGDELHEQGQREPLDALGPVVPMVGREAASAQLAECWQAVLDGRSQLTLVVGEEGVGKTRLARSFIDSATARRRTLVLESSAVDQFPQPSRRLLVDALRQALPDPDDDLENPFAKLPRDTRRELAWILPELAHARPTASAPPSAEELAESVAALLQQLARSGDEQPSGWPVVLLLDDLHWADAATLELVERLPRWLPGSRVWILCTYDPGAPAGGHVLERLAARDGDGVVTAIGLERLERDDIEEIGAALVDRPQSAELCDLLESVSGGLPLGVVTLINAMWDEGDLVADSAGRWHLRGALERWRESGASELDQVLLARVRRLSTSIRRLASMAAAIGQRFDVELLEQAEGEHPAVVEVALGVLLERWLIRQRRQRWNPGGLESTLVLWSRGARRGEFQFDHPRIRALLAESINPLRRQVLHRQIVAALEHLHATDLDSVAEDLAFHSLEAGEWERAFSALRAAADHARKAGDPVGSRACDERAQRVVERLVRQAGDDAERERWQQEQRELEARSGA